MVEALNGIIKSGISPKVTAEMVANKYPLIFIAFQSRKYTGKRRALRIYLSGRRSSKMSQFTIEVYSISRNTWRVNI